MIAGYFADSGQVVSDFVSSIIIGIIVIVVAVPEGLPLMIAIVCSLNMKKMLKSKVLVRKLIGIETSGSINILFSDKTGTITKGKLEVVRFLDGNATPFDSFSGLSNQYETADRDLCACQLSGTFFREKNHWRQCYRKGASLLYRTQYGTYGRH